MKVHFLSYPTAFSIVGGGEVQLLKTMAALNKIGINANLLDIYDTNEWRHIEILHLFSVCEGIELYVHWARVNNVPFVVSPIIWPTDNMPRQEIDRIRYILLHAKAILPNSRAEKHKIIEKLDIPDHGQYFIVNNACDVDLFKFNSDCRMNSKSEFLLTVANIDKRKNLIRLAEAVTNLGVKTIIAGEIRDREIFKTLCESYSTYVTCIGPIVNASDDHLNLLKDCSAFILPSECETPGIAALEAGVFGVPIIITSEGATYEYFQDYVTYIDPMSVENIELKINEVLSDKKSSYTLLSELCSKYTWDLAASSTKNAYEYALSKKEI